MSKNTFPKWGFYPGGGEIILACRQVFEDYQVMLGFMEGPSILELDCVVNLDYSHEYFKKLDHTKIQELVCSPRFTCIMVAHHPGPSIQGILEADIKQLRRRIPALKKVTVVADLSEHGYFIPEVLVDKKFGLNSVEWEVEINVRKVNGTAANGVPSNDRAFGLMRKLLPEGNFYHSPGSSLAQFRARLEGPRRNGSYSTVDQTIVKNSTQINKSG